MGVHPCIINLATSITRGIVFRQSTRRTRTLLAIPFTLETCLLTLRKMSSKPCSQSREGTSDCASEQNRTGPCASSNSRMCPLRPKLFTSSTVILCTTASREAFASASPRTPWVSGLAKVLDFQALQHPRVVCLVCLV
jgi:hypothetical protein